MALDLQSRNGFLLESNYTNRVNPVAKGSFEYSSKVPLRKVISDLHCLHRYFSFEGSHRCSLLPQRLQNTPCLSRKFFHKRIQRSSVL
jgi:hypothetical protein